MIDETATTYVAVIVEVYPTYTHMYIYIYKGKGVPLHAKQAQRGGTGIALPLLDPGARKV